MHGGAQQRAQLHLEDLGLVEAHPDGAPAEERIGFVRKSADGELVAADVVRADHDRMRGEGVQHLDVRGELLVLVRHCRATDHQELGPHQPDALGAAGGAGRRFVGHVDVRPQGDAHAVGGDRLLARVPLHEARFFLLDAGTRAVFGDALGRGITDEDAVGAVQHGHRPRLDPRRRVEQSDDGGETERTREDGHVRRARAGVGGDARNGLAVELHRERRREVVRHEDGVAPLGEPHRVVIREVEQERQHANLHVGEVAYPLAHQRVGGPRKMFAPLEQDEVERLLGGEALADERRDTHPQVGVLANGDLDVEDGRFFGSRVLLGAVAHAAQALNGARQGVAEPRDLVIHLVRFDHARGNLGHLPAQEVHRPDDDPGRRGNAGVDLAHVSAPRTWRR